VILCATRYHAQAHVTSGALIHYALSLATRKTLTAGGLIILLATVCYGDFCRGLQLWLLLLLLLLLFFFFLKIVF